MSASRGNIDRPHRPINKKLHRRSASRHRAEKNRASGVCVDLEAMRREIMALKRVSASRRKRRDVWLE